METITFYSYKGGVGRTLALSNTASYLTKFGLNVCILDFDLEAPGLHYKFGMKQQAIKKGLLDYIYDFSNSKKKTKHTSLEQIVYNIPSNETGTINIIPAGNIYSSEYWKKLSSINWNKMLYDKDQLGILFFLELKEKIEREIKPDFLLIDSRTGVTEIGGICSTLLPDKVVLLLINNDENIDGTIQILNGIINAKRLSNQEPIKFYFCLTRIPFNVESRNEEEKIIIKLRNQLALFNKNLANYNIHIIHSDRNLELSETIAFSRAKRHGTLLYDDYLQLFSGIISSDVIIPKLDILINKELNNIYYEPDKTQANLENIVYTYPHAKTYESLLKFYIVRNILDQKFVKTFNEYAKISNNIDPQIALKYLFLYIGKEEYAYRRIEFNLKLIERLSYELLQNNLQNFQEAIYRLSRSYIDIGNYDKSLELLKEIKDNPEKRADIISEVFRVLIELKKFEIGKKLYEENKDEIEKNVRLKIEYLRFLKESKDIKELSQMMFKDEGTTEKILIDNNLFLAIQIFELLNKKEIIMEKVDSLLSEALIQENQRKLYEIGQVFFRLGRKQEFIDKASKYEISKSLIRELENRFERG